jgi:hypothetical protein
VTLQRHRLVDDLVRAHRVSFAPNAPTGAHELSVFDKPGAWLAR